MAKTLIHTFAIKGVSKIKRNRKPEIKASRLCTAIVIKEYNNWFCNVSFIENNNEKTIKIPINKNSLELKGKTHVYTTSIDGKGRYTCIIRSEYEARVNPGSAKYYSVVKDNCVIVGKIVSIDGVLEFQYEALIAHSPNCRFKLNNILVNEDKPLFK